MCNNILLNKIFINDEKLIKFANSVLNFGYKLEGGKSRNSVKTDNNIVVKSNSDYDEYYRMCLCFIMKIPINPPIGLLILKNHNNVIEKYIIEKYIIEKYIIEKYIIEKYIIEKYITPFSLKNGTINYFYL
jgi:hypothetical protein